MKITDRDMGFLLRDLLRDHDHTAIDRVDEHAGLVGEDVVIEGVNDANPRNLIVHLSNGQQFTVSVSL